MLIINPIMVNSFAHEGFHSILRQDKTKALTILCIVQSSQLTRALFEFSDPNQSQFHIRALLILCRILFDPTQITTNTNGDDIKTWLTMRIRLARDKLVEL